MNDCFWYKLSSAPVTTDKILNETDRVWIPDPRSQPPHESVKGYNACKQQLQ